MRHSVSIIHGGKIRSWSHDNELEIEITDLPHSPEVAKFVGMYGPNEVAVLNSALSVTSGQSAILFDQSHLLDRIKDEYKDGGYIKEGRYSLRVLSLDGSLRDIVPPPDSKQIILEIVSAEDVNIP